MCLIAWNWQPDSATPLVLVGNRDEFYARPALPLHWWHGGQLLAGQDLQAGGTWLGVGRSGRLAALTNVRAPDQMRPDAPSRGELVTGFLRGRLSAQDYLGQLATSARDYNPFNLLLRDGPDLLAFESQTASVTRLPPGLGAVSNAGFGTPWPKLVRLRQGLQASLERSGTPADAVPEAALLALLHDARPASPAQLPATGIPPEMERALSAAFVATAHYGTRACSVVRIGQSGARVLEISHGAQGPQGVAGFAWEFTGAATAPPFRKS